MSRMPVRLTAALVAVAAFTWPDLAKSAIINSGDPVGTSGYNVASIDAGVSIDFAATTPNSANSNTIGKLTVTLTHSNLNFLGFNLVQEAPGGNQNFSAGAGLRLLVDVIDTNGMTAPWVDYHIRATDFSPITNPGDETSHLPSAHFHDTNSAFGSNPLVLQGEGDNVTQLNFGLGSPVNPGNKFTASNILLHERNYADISRSFRVELAPSITPEPSTFVVFVGLGAGALGFARRKRSK